jgi:hypothetical protein
VDKLAGHFGGEHAIRPNGDCQVTAATASTISRMRGWISAAKPVKTTRFNSGSSACFAAGVRMSGETWALDRPHIADASVALQVAAEVGSM